MLPVIIFRLNKPDMDCFNSRKAISATTIKDGMYEGVIEDLLAIIKDKHQWDGIKPQAAITTVMEGNRIDDPTWVVMGSVGAITFTADSLWKEAVKGIKVTLTLKDLSGFKFPCRGNASWWNKEGESYTVSYLQQREEDVDTVVITEGEARLQGVGDFSCRLCILPTSSRTARVWLGACPVSKEDLHTRMGEDKVNSHQVPVILLALGAPRNSKFLEIPFNNMEEKEGYGIGIIPWLEVSADGMDDAKVPTTEDMRRMVFQLAEASRVKLTTTGPVSIQNRIQSFQDGKSAIPLLEAAVFPPSAREQAQATNTQAARTG